MTADGSPKRTIWLKPDDPAVVQIIDQRQLPHRLVIADLRTVEDAAAAIKDMAVRGAPLIGATAAWGLYLAARKAARDNDPDPLAALTTAGAMLKAQRPTAVNLAWAVDRVLAALPAGGDAAALVAATRARAEALADEDAEICRMIGVHGLALIQDIADSKGGGPVNVLTHCNAGRLACIEWGTATSPVYQAHARGLDVHVWVDETRPRNQGAALTAWELAEAGIAHRVITDNAGGHLMQRGQVDLVVVGTDRTTRIGDVANKIGTYLKALAAHDNGVPFYVALPSPTIDWDTADGFTVPIEERSADEVRTVQGRAADGGVVDVLVTPDASPAANPAFDVTPARLVTGLITERGICPASEHGLLGLFPERRR